MLGDVIVAEPDALIGFDGPRVIEQTIRQQLPPGFQRSEFLLEHGMVDMVVPRPQMHASLARVLRWFNGAPAEGALDGKLTGEAPDSNGANGHGDGESNGARNGHGAVADAGDLPA
jgi:hypothetical protein